MIHKVFGSSLGQMCLCQVSSLWDMDNSFKLRDFCPHNLRVPKRPILTGAEWISLSLFFPRFVCVAYIVFFSVFWIIFNCYTTPNDLRSEIFSSRFAISSKRTFTYGYGLRFPQFYILKTYKNFWRSSWKKWIIKSFWSSPSEVFLEKGHTLAWVFSCKFAAYFQNIFSWEHLWRAASGYFEKRTFSQKQ